MVFPVLVKGECERNSGVSPGEGRWPLPPEKQGSGALRMNMDLSIPPPEGQGGLPPAVYFDVCLTFVYEASVTRQPRRDLGYGHV